MQGDFCAARRTKGISSRVWLAHLFACSLPLSEAEIIMYCDAFILQAAGEGDRDQDGLYNQKQPRHLRRRTKSWTSRKAPASFRNKADAKGKKRKQPAQAGATAAASADTQPAGHRKSLRRPRALLAARSLHGRAQPELADSSSTRTAEQQPQQAQQQLQRDLWLETHIWHAKRMTMGSCWGCALPLSARRGAKAAAAAAADHCTVKDASHWRALQLTGAGVAQIAAVLCSMCDPGDRQFLQPAQVYRYICIYFHVQLIYLIKFFEIGCASKVILCVLSCVDSLVAML
jgi:Ribonucleases P/MRP protein subunit POP1